jgi:serine/threonine-protein kinase
VRLACAQVEEALGNARGRATASQFAQFTALLGRLGRARTQLADPEARAAYDAGAGNYQGVARCLAAGLPAAALERLHADWAARFPDRAARAIELLAAAGRLAHDGDRQRAGELLEQALAIDPLNPDLQRRFAALRASGGR